MAPDPIAGLERDVKLRATVAAFTGQRFAVVDGGHFGDLPALLRRQRLFARSLFLDQADVEIQKAGPWLVALDQEPGATDKVLAVIGEKPAAVFWSAEAGEAVLYRHLRTIAMARIPVWAAEGREVPAPSDDPEACRTVFFRHFDPRVLGALLPCLDAAQFSRFLGPADEVAFVAKDFRGLRRIVRDDAWPPARTGLLTIRSDQMGSLSRRRVDASRQRIAAYLRDAAPDDSASLSDQDLLAHVVHSEGVGGGIGLSSERAHAKWAYLMLMTHGGIESAPGVRTFLQAPNRVPDRQMDLFMRSLIAGRQRLGDP